MNEKIRANLLLGSIMVLATSWASPVSAGDLPTPPVVPVLVNIDCGQVVNIMRGGLGASWHAMEAEIPYNVKHPIFTSYSHGGSGWGAYPPAEDERAWQQIYCHASWLAEAGVAAPGEAGDTLPLPLR